MVGWLNVWHHGVTIIPSNTEAKGGFGGGGGGGGAVGVLTEWRGISSRLEGSPVDCSIVSLSPFEGERENYFSERVSLFAR